MGKSHVLIYVWKRVAFPLNKEHCLESLSLQFGFIVWLSELELIYTFSPLTSYSSSHYGEVY